MFWRRKEVSVGKEHPSRVIPLQSLYAEVTKQMAGFRDDEAQELSTEERHWLTTLIGGFEERFTNWVSNEKTYLQMLYTQKSKVVTMAGHAYLHVCYDLPIVMPIILSRNRVQ